MKIVKILQRLLRVGLAAGGLGGVVRGMEGLPRPGCLARGKGPGQGGHHHTYDLTNYDLLPCIIDRISIKLTIIIIINLPEFA